MDISKHELVPKHSIVSEKEKREILKKYGVSLRQLPRILSSDPMVIKLGAKPGDIIRIERKSPTAGKTIYYRVVVKG
ncbi:MAG: DNA-directed RNA polymerase subunit H [Candidatus Aenigmarchaeota archaeon]|nr:DNA-directed RNA polymerase subunit H [Candidatus Aenigmarchaeota archaeon]